MDRDYNELGRIIIGASFEVRKNSGRGLRECYYQHALAWELRQHDILVETEVTIPCLYKGHIIHDAFRADIIVERKIIIETKALYYCIDEEVRQLYTYLKLMDYRLGYLINFGARDFSPGNFKNEEYPYEKGIYRVVNDFKDPSKKVLY